MFTQDGGGMFTPKEVTSYIRFLIKVITIFVISLVFLGTFLVLRYSVNSTSKCAQVGLEMSQEQKLADANDLMTRPG